MRFVDEERERHLRGATGLPYVKMLTGIIIGITVFIAGHET